MKLGNRPEKRIPRRGTALFLTVFGTATIVAVVTISAIMTTRIKTQGTTAAQCVADAGMLAMTAVEHALATLEAATVAGNGNPMWRTQLSSGTVAVTMSFGAGRFGWMLVDEGDGNLADDPSESVRLYGIGQVADVVRVRSVLLRPVGTGLGCLEVALHAGDDLSFDGALVDCDQTISANDLVDSTGATVNSDVEAVGSIIGGTYNGALTTGISPRAMPDEGTFEYYRMNGTNIDVMSLPGDDDGVEINAVLLGPNSNPFGGALNKEGIYVIDCRGRPVSIHDSRLVATLVLLDPGTGSTIGGSLNWEPVVENYPALLVQGDIAIGMDPAPLTEQGVNVNFNPIGTRYQGEEDADTLDSYPSKIKGLIYVSNDVDHPTGGVFLDGVMVVGRRLTSNGTLQMKYQQQFLDSPPPGFSGGGEMFPVTGTWRWDSLPPEVPQGLPQPVEL